MARKQLRFGRGFSVAAVVGRKRQSLRAGTLLLIERGTTHEIRNTGRTPLETLNLYVPPAYTSQGDALPRGHG
jgi:mannose-6-phosphate isomerase-like protein (cupin superfamily)